jgi:acetyl esterase
VEAHLYPEARAAARLAASEPSVADEGYDVAAARAEAQRVAAQEPREPVAEVRDVDADGVPCRLYVPEGADPGVVVHLHGGGFVMNDVEVHDNAARRLADRCGTAVLSVDYRRPPEHVFPAAVEDVDAVVGWVRRELADGSGAPAYVHGDSAGANLALVAALHHPDAFRAVALTYPFLDPEAAGASYALEGVGFEPREARWYWDQYAPAPIDRTDPDLAPLRSDRLADLPPTLVVTADADPLRDEGELLAGRLADLGVEVVATRYLGQLHGFWRHPSVFPAAEPLTRQIAGFFRSHR